MDNIEAVRAELAELRSLVVAGSPQHRSYPAESWSHTEIVKRLKEIVPVGYTL